jgi:hypothetical protein
MKLTAGSMVLAASLSVSGVAMAAESAVVWADPSCEYLIMQLPGGDADEAFGLFAVKSKPMPEVGDVVEGSIGDAPAVEVVDKATGKKFSLYHWASGKSAEALVRHSPVHCTSRYKKKS